MKNLAKIVFVVLTFICMGCEAEQIDIEDEGINIEQQGVDKKKIKKPGTQGGN